MHGHYSKEIAVNRPITTLDLGHPHPVAQQQQDKTRYLVPLGRLLFVLIFLTTYTHFQAQTIAYAALQGVPLAGIAVPLSGVIALAGGISVLIGYRAKLGAWLLVLFLVPVSFTLHRFWDVSDPMMAALQRAQFLKNVSMIGGALLIAYFGAGPISVDAARRQR